MSERVHCPTHGERFPTFVCRHLVRGSGLGFFEPNRPPVSDDESDERCAWCGACEQARQKAGGWNEESEKYAGIALVCDACFDAARSRNRLGSEGA